jgi:hypothetical protein
MSSKYSLLYKTWTADLRRRMLKKRQNEEKLKKNKKTKFKYVYIANTDKDCNLLDDRPVLSLGRMPHDKQNRNYLDYSQNPGTQRQDGLTD